MSSAYGSEYYPASGALPMAVPMGKDGHMDHYGGYYAGGDRGHGAYSVSPPESEAAGSSSAASAGLASYSSGSGYSSSAMYSSAAGYGDASGYASYAASSHGDYESAASASGVDFNEYVQERFDEVRNPVVMDNCTVTQAKVSGGLNAKHRELLDLQKKAQARLAKSRARYTEGMAAAYEVREDLEWTQKTLSSIQSKASKKHSKEYKKARERYPSPDY